jgi:chaperonin cofactor prefoldin
MIIGKNDFKIIFNKMINNSESQNNKLIKNISSNNYSGDNEIDQVIKTNSSHQVLKIMNKIMNKVIMAGGDNGTSQVTSSENPVMAVPSATSSDMPAMMVPSATSSDMPAMMNPSATSSDMPAMMVSSTTSSEIPVSDIFVAKPKAVEAPSNVKLTIKKLIEKLKEKSELLDKREASIKSSESDLNNKKVALEQIEMEAKTRIENLRKEIDELSKQKDDLNKQKSELESNISSLKSEKDSYISELSEISLNFKDLGLSSETSQADKGFLGGIFGL